MALIKRSKTCSAESNKKLLLDKQLLLFGFYPVPTKMTTKCGVYFLFLIVLTNPKFKS